MKLTLKKNVCFIFSMVALVTLVAGCGPGTVAVPETFSNWNSKEGTFALEYPEGWEANGNGSRTSGIAWAEFKKGTVTIRVDASFADSVNGDVAGAFGGGFSDDSMETPEEWEPEAVIQDSWLEYYQEKYPGYKELPGVTTRIPLGDTRLNEFSGTSGFHTVKGIRTTTMARDRSVTFLATCPESQWDEFQPVFMRMLESMAAGVEE